MGAVGGLAVGGLTLGALELRQAPARVVALRVRAYDDELHLRLEEAIRGFPRALAKLRGGRVLLKPNLVEFRATHPVNTEPAFIVAAAEAMRRLGAREVVVGEGPGHVRDTEALLELSGLGPALREARLPFIDLNLDEVVDVALPLGLTRRRTLPVARSVAAADLVVSLPRMKTHHLCGVTLSLKNMLGVVPGVEVGWPKNPLHWLGIEACVTELWAALRPGLALVDGRVGMEGDGPILGAPIEHGLVLVSDDLPAIDAFAARCMGIDPRRVGHLVQVTKAGGTTSRYRIEAAGDDAPRLAYALPSHLSLLAG